MHAKFRHGTQILELRGLDVIFGAINGAKEGHELDDQIGKLNSAVEKLHTADADLTAKLSHSVYDYSSKSLLREEFSDSPSLIRTNSHWMTKLARQA